MKLADYFSSIQRTAKTTLEGMAVTFSHLFREPITIQYPDRMDRPVSEMLPERYRGLLEVQMDICTGCKRCERACPIECIAIVMACYLTLSLLTSALMNWYNRRAAIKER